MDVTNIIEVGDMLFTLTDDTFHVEVTLEEIV